MMRSRKLFGRFVKTENRPQPARRPSVGSLSTPVDLAGASFSFDKRMTRILVVEDQRTLLRNLVGGLEEEGYEVLAAASIGEGRAAILRQPDVLVLDLMLPDGSGIELLRQLRSDGFTRPILVLTARDSVDDRVEGLDAGADDYLVKPFSFNELLARLRALLRRGSLEQQAILRLEGLEVDRLKRVATAQRPGA